MNYEGTYRSEKRKNRSSNAVILGENSYMRSLFLNKLFSSRHGLSELERRNFIYATVERGNSIKTWMLKILTSFWDGRILPHVYFRMIKLQMKVIKEVQSLNQVHRLYFTGWSSYERHEVGAQLCSHHRRWWEINNMSGGEPESFRAVSGNNVEDWSDM